MREPDRIIRLKTVLFRTGLTRSTLYRKIAEGTFPAQIKISVNGAGWQESEIDCWVADPVRWQPKDKAERLDGAPYESGMQKGQPRPT
ncbi:helix-turn-helix transcriptional regulator [Mesorhizobium sp. CA5]|uniref:helix-turn-helix transcriptional regulator n=1 Tax=Mesorhizobium sp. CA5 TaxID=2876638 RepID=UPI001CD0D01B|nr:AlpA family phage regulatory protein [Mesorhizobium sp. CA5]MBZ9845680.1 AlpA family phage regulatory protein [Mesorhizobium sp. CA5]